MKGDEIEFIPGELVGLLIILMVYDIGFPATYINFK